MALCLSPLSARAQQEAQPSLSSIGQQFAERIGKKLQQADALLAGGNKLQLKELQTGSTIPEGEPLIMRGLVGKTRIPLAEDIQATRLGQKLMVSLADFCTALEIPVKVSQEDAAAAGWFPIESRPVALDAKKGTALVAGQAVRVDQGDLAVASGDLMVSAELLERIFGLNIDVDLSSLTLFFTSASPLPIELREKRSHQAKYTATANPTATLPLTAEPYHVFTPPYFDVSLGAAYSRANSSAPANQNFNWSVIGAGDVLGFTSRTFASGNKNNSGTGEALSTLRQTFGREDADGKMAGIKNFEFGDVDTVNLSLTGGATQEQGVYFSNQLPGEVTTQSHIDVKGDGQPGWDVELYNNDSLLGLQTVENDGRYNFPSIFLFEGDNTLRLVFYGPQGQQREEIRHVVSSASTLRAGEGKWETSLTRTNITTYNANQPDLPNDGDPHLTARYEYSFGPQASANIGATHRSDTDGIIQKDKDYLQGGGAFNAFGALFNADAAYDLDGEYLLDVLARRSFGYHQGGLEITHSSGHFSQGSLNSFVPENSVTANLRGPFADKFMGLSNLNYTADATYSSSSDGGKLEQIGGSIAGNFKTIGGSTGLHYTKTDGPGSTGDGQLTGNTTIGGYAGLGRWRFSSEYDVSPFQLTNLSANYTYPFNPKLEGIADVTHTELDNRTALALSARWRPDKVAVTPRVAVDTNHQFTAGVNVNFSLADNPYDQSRSGYTMFNRTLTATGGIAARVFLDRNGNGIYDGDDELLPDVDVRSVQSSGKAVTDSSGVAFLPTLQRSLRTDIVVPQETLPDPYYMTSSEGVSVRPRPGVTSRIDFPVVVAGEMDGQVSYAGDEGTFTNIHGVTVRLFAPDGTQEKSAPVGSDGYFSISSIRPGVYSMVVDTSRSSKPGTVPPKTYVFKSDGTNFFGEKITLTPDDETRFAFRSVNDSPVKKFPGHVITPEDVGRRSMIVHVGEYSSRIALTLGWYRMKLISGWDTLFTPELAFDDIPADPATASLNLWLKPAQPVTMKQAMDTCRMFQTYAYKCTIEIVAKYNEVLPPKPVPLLPRKTAKADDAPPPNQIPIGTSPGNQPLLPEQKPDPGSNEPPPETIPPSAPATSPATVVQ